MSALMSLLLMYFQIWWSFKWFATQIAFKEFLFVVLWYVHFRPNSFMNRFSMIFQICQLWKCFIAQFTGMWPFACMGEIVFFQVVAIAKTFITQMASIRTYAFMNRLLMLCQIRFVDERFITLIAYVWFFSCSQNKTFWIYWMIMCENEVVKKTLTCVC